MIGAYHVSAQLGTSKSTLAGQEGLTMPTPDQFAARLQRVAAQIEARADALQDRWGEDVAQEMRDRVPVRTGALKNSINASDGVVTVGADYGIYVDRGTSRMPPQEFVRPSVNARREEIAREGIDEAVQWLLGR